MTARLCRNEANHSLHLFLLFALVSLIYSGSLYNGWHLDDPANILHNNSLHLDNLSFTALQKTFFANPMSPGELFRPVANLSFALNWFYGKDEVLGYHLVNVSIHILTTFFLYITCLLLFESPALKEKKPYGRHDIALLTACLWAVSPIHTQAVTYIVQRMAQLAALFSLSSILLYLLLRLTRRKRHKTIFLILLILCILLAIGSKENAIMVVPSLLLVELIFFSKPAHIIHTLKKQKIIAISSAFAILFPFILFISHHSSVVLSYGHRNFTMLERLLTESRILLFYLSQIFFPVASRFSIEHDFSLSHSIIDPLITLPSILFCIILILTAITRFARNPFFSFAILFFFLNHLIESSIVPLELIFEHRNYLPSLFLFLPISFFIFDAIAGLTKWEKITPRSLLTISLTVVFIIFSSTSTIKRNEIWATSISLWSAAINQAPNSSRAKLTLANEYIAQKRYLEASILLDEVDPSSGATQNNDYPISLNGKATIAFRNGRFNDSIKYLEQALSLRNDYTDVAYQLTDQYIKQKNFAKALDLTTTQYEQFGNPNMLIIKSIILLHLNRPQEALKTLHSAKVFFPNSPLITVGYGKAMSMMGHFYQADVIYRVAGKTGGPNTILLRIENALKWQKPAYSDKLIQFKLSSIPAELLFSQLTPLSLLGSFLVPIDGKLVLNEISRVMTKPSDYHN